MSKPSSHPESDRNLLFGILAVQLNFISRDDLVSGMNSWVLDKKKSLGEIMLEQGRLSVEQVQTLEALIVQHLKMHDNDPERSLQALRAGTTVASILTPMSDSGSARIGAEPQTATFSAAESDRAVRYRRLRPHASGGLGDVFVAEDAELHREVALKEIKPRHAGDRLCRHRFVREAEITGGLEHPGVVPVYGLGAYPDGRLYYAMRFIRGDSMRTAIDEFHAAGKGGRTASERSLAFRQLLRRFVDVCNAVAYAHSRGVLHRDLKPGNIMLGKFGETLVVDWGLAKAGHRDADAEGTLAAEPALQPSSSRDGEETRPGAAIGTIPFMSPEQAAGRLDVLGPTSDIYSLGSTLYMLLTGQRPYRGEDDASTLTLVQKGQFTPPRTLKSDTPPALDAICRKAMAYEPKDRYPTALDLAADVEHWLADEPVAAYAEPWTVRAARLARRHRAKVVAAAVLLASAVVALSASTALVWAEQKRTAQQRASALSNFALARELSFNSIDLIESTQVDLASNPNFHSKRRELLTAASKACRRFLEQEPDDPALSAHAAQVFRYAANFHRLENQVKIAEPLYADSVRLEEKLAAQFPDDRPRLDKLASSLRDQASILATTGRLRAAADNYTRALEIADQLKHAREADATVHRLEGTLCLDLASVEYSRGKLKEARHFAERAEALFRDLKASSENAHAYDALLQAAALSRIAVIDREEGLLKEARGRHYAAVKILEEMKSKQPAQAVPADVRNHWVRARFDQARTLAKVPDKRAAAETNISGAAAEWQDLAKSYAKIPQYVASEAGAHLALGQIRNEDKRYEESLGNLEQARKLLEHLVDNFPDTPNYRYDLGRTYLALAQRGRAVSDPGAAAWLRKADDTLTKAAEQSPDSALIKRSLEEARMEQQRKGE